MVSANFLRIELKAELIRGIVDVFVEQRRVGFDLHRLAVGQEFQNAEITFTAQRPRLIVNQHLKCCFAAIVLAGKEARAVGRVTYVPVERKSNVVFTDKLLPKLLAVVGRRARGIGVRAPGLFILLCGEVVAGAIAVEIGVCHKDRLALRILGQNVVGPLHGPQAGAPIPRRGRSSRFHQRKTNGSYW